MGPGSLSEPAVCQSRCEQVIAVEMKSRRLTYDEDFGVKSRPAVYLRRREFESSY